MDKITKPLTLEGYLVLYNQPPFQDYICGEFEIAFVGETLIVISTEEFKYPCGSIVSSRTMWSMSIYQVFTILKNRGLIV